MRIQLLILGILFLSPPIVSAIFFISNCTTIDSPGTYVLTSDIKSSRSRCITINSNDVFLDCQGHSIEKGIIYVDGKSRITIANCKIRFGVVGIYDSVNVTLINNTAYNNFVAFAISSSTGITLINNTAYSNSDGFEILSSTGITLINNIAYNNFEGFFIKNSHAITLINNIAYNNSEGGFAIGESENVILINNTARNNEAGFGSGNNTRNLTLINNTFCHNKVDLVLRPSEKWSEIGNLCDKAIFIEDLTNLTVSEFNCTYKCSGEKKKSEEEPQKPQPQTRSDCPYGTVEKQGVILCKPVGIPTDTPCKKGWPAHEGSEIYINEKNFACDLFEVTRPDVISLAEEALNCCLNDCSGDCHSLCDVAYEYSGLNTTISDDTLKKCVALYEIYGNGPAARYMQDYYYNEIWCKKEPAQANCYDRIHNITAQLSCRQMNTKYPVGWVSDNQLERNSCYFSDLPAHVSFNTLSTGTCVDYSISTTALLRVSGFKKDDVYTVTSFTKNEGHAYNLIKFPGDRKYTIIDTVGNNPSVYVPGDLPSTWWPYCEFGYKSCYNDGGEVLCPQKADVYGCTSCEEKDFFYYRCNGDTLQLLHQTSNCEYEWKDVKKCRYGCKYGQCKKPSCSSGYLDEFRCSGSDVERKYRYSDCTTTWRTVEYCPYGCSNGACLQRTCEPGPIGEPRCMYYGQFVGIDYQKSDCSKETKYLEACLYGCTNGRCNDEMKEGEGGTYQPECESTSVFKCEGSTLVQEITREDCTHETIEVEKCQYGCNEDSGACEVSPFHEEEPPQCVSGLLLTANTTCRGNDVMIEYTTQTCNKTYIYYYSCDLGCENGSCLYYDSANIELEVEKSVPKSITIGDVIEVIITVKNKGKLPTIVEVTERIGDADPIEPEPHSAIARKDMIAATPPYFFWRLALDPSSQQSVNYKIKPRKVGEYLFSPTSVVAVESNKRFYSDTHVTTVLPKENNVCEPENGENAITAPSECPTASKDELCDLKKDNKCDPDCANGDPDCGFLQPISNLDSFRNYCCPFALVGGILIISLLMRRVKT